MAQSESRSRNPLVSFRVTDEDKRRIITMRAAQLGFDNRSDYLRALVEEDLNDADMPDLK